MTEQRIRTINAVMHEAIAAIPNGDDQQLFDWVMANRYPLFPKELTEALIDRALWEFILGAAGQIRDKALRAWQRERLYKGYFSDDVPF